MDSEKQLDFVSMAPAVGVARNCDFAKSLKVQGDIVNYAIETNNYENGSEIYDVFDSEISVELLPNQKFIHDGESTRAVPFVI